jgi:hypothetical protein
MDVKTVFARWHVHEICNDMDSALFFRKRDDAVRHVALGGMQNCHGFGGGHRRCLWHSSVLLGAAAKAENCQYQQPHDSGVPCPIHLKCSP